jgi:hypothetical protein
MQHSDELSSNTQLNRIAVQEGLRKKNRDEQSKKRLHLYPANYIACPTSQTNKRIKTIPKSNRPTTLARITT